MLPPTYIPFPNILYLLMMIGKYSLAITYNKYWVLDEVELAKQELTINNILSLSPTLSKRSFLPGYTGIAVRSCDFAAKQLKKLNKTPRDNF